MECLLLTNLDREKGKHVQLVTKGLNTKVDAFVRQRQTLEICQTDRARVEEVKD